MCSTSYGQPENGLNTAEEILRSLDFKQIFQMNMVGGALSQMKLRPYLRNDQLQLQILIESWKSTKFLLKLYELIN